MKKIKWTQPMSLTLSSVIVKLLAVIFAAACIYAPFAKYLVMEFGLSLPLFLTAFYLCAAPAFTALYFLSKMLNNIRAERIFIHENAKILRILSWCCYFVGIVMAVYSFFAYPFIIISAAAAFFGLILRVLKNVFVKAVEIREENDGTI